MTTSLVIAWALGQNLVQPGLFASTFPRPTGMNGLEEYISAAVLMSDGYWFAYGDWVPPEGRAELTAAIASGHRYVDNSVPQDDPKLVALKERLNTLSMLEMRQEEEIRFGKVLTLVDAGNQKPCLFPESWLHSKTPILTQISGFAKLARDAAYVDESKSQTTAAIARLGSALIFTDHICRTTYIQSILASLIGMTVLQEFADDLDRFSLDDAQDIEVLVNSLLQGPPNFVDAYRTSILTMRSSVAESIHSLKVEALAPTKDKELAAYNQLINGMSGADVDDMIVRVQSAISDSGSTFLARFAGPEEGWLPQDTPENSAPPETALKTPADLEAYYVAHWTLPDISQPRRLLSALRCRTMLRLLRLHARIIVFRWEQDRLPKNIAELRLPKEYDFDPLSNQKFVYERTSEGYRLYSNGWKGAGRIELGGIVGGGQVPANAKP